MLMDTPDGDANPGDSGPDSPRWRRRKAFRSREVLDAALDAFVARGYAGTRLEDVARAAGVAKSTLYLYFANKEELFKAVVRDSIVPMIVEANQIVDQWTDSSAALLAFLIEGWWERIGNTRSSGIMKLVTSEAGNFPGIARFYLDEVITPGQAIFGRALQRGIDHQEFSCPDVPATVHVICSPVMMMALWEHTFAGVGERPASAERQLQALISTLTRSLAATPS